MILKKDTINQCSGGQGDTMSKSRADWKDERDFYNFSKDFHHAEWIDRKILYPIPALINGKYPGDEKFKCECGSHVGLRHEDGSTECILCYRMVAGA